MKNKILLVFVVVMVAVVVLLRLEANSPNVELSKPLNSSEERVISCDKAENCCVVSDDCRYVWQTGGCNTLEYVTATRKVAEAQGRRDGEVPPRENVTCTCEFNKCVTYN